MTRQNRRKQLLKLVILLAPFLSLGVAADEPESVPGLHSGGQWVAAIAQGQNGNRLLIEDIESGDVYEVGDFSETGLEYVAWVDENQLALVSDGIRVLRISPPDAEDNHAVPRFEWVQSARTNSQAGTNQPRWFEKRPDAQGSLYLGEISRLERKRRIDNGKKTRYVPLRDN